MQEIENDKPKYWIVRSKVDSQDMNQLFVDYGIWYANSGAVGNSLRKIAKNDFVALVRTPDTIHALGKVAQIKTAHEIGCLPGQEENDLRIFFIESTEKEHECRKGWLKVSKRAPYTLRRSLQQVKREDHIKKIWGDGA